MFETFYYMSMNESTEDSEIDSLIKQLKYSSIPLQRERAAYILANFRDSKVSEVLLSAQLNDPNPRVRDAASQALASLLTDDELDEEEQEIERLLLENKDKVKQLFNITKDFEIIRKGMKKVRPSGKDSLELRQLFKAVKQDRFLQSQPNIQSVINAILLLPIEDSDLGRDVAIALTEILRITSNESLRMNAMGCLNNIITNIDKYTPLFGIAESYIMIFKATDESEMRITAFKCLEEIIFKRKSLAKLSQYTSDIIKLLTFSYEKQLREITLFAYPDLVLATKEKISYLVDIMIGIARATYEDNLREMGLKALEALLKKEMLTELNVERIIKILKSHHDKNIRMRGIELFMQLVFQFNSKAVEYPLNALFNIIMKIKQEDICYTSLQTISNFAFKHDISENVKTIFLFVENIALSASHPLIVNRAFQIVNSIVLNFPEKVTEDFSTNFIECLKIHSDLGIMDQVITTFTKLCTVRNIIPSDLKQYIKTLLYLSNDTDILESLLRFFTESMITNEKILAEKVINRLMEIMSLNKDKESVFYELSNLDISEFLY